MEGTINSVEDSQMAQAEKSATHTAATTPPGGTNAVNRGPRDRLNGRLEIQGDLKIAGHVEGELKASGDVSVGEGSTIQASIEGARSEEHTSELQSQFHLVCRLLLEKKKKNILMLFHIIKKKSTERLSE